MRTSPPLLALAFALACSVLAASSFSHSQEVLGARRYVVAPGDTVSSIAQHLGVTVRALAERNHLDPPYTLRVGHPLRVPSSVPPAILRTLPLADPLPGATPAPSPPHAPVVPAHRPSHAPERTRPGVHPSPRDPWARAHHRGTVHLVREYNDERLTIDLHRVSRPALRRMERFLRFNDGRHHAIHPRLVRQLELVSEHFGGRTVHVISGYRPFRRGQYTPHSNHNSGRAMDFRIEGVSNRALRDFCRTFPATGCGYYPRSVFVHMDVRDESATWVDWSRPGQRPMYGREDRPPEPAHAASAPPPAADTGGSTGADEDLDEVADDDAHVRTAPPATDPDAPAEPVPPANPPSPAHTAEPPLPGQPAPSPAVPNETP